ncbi:formate dehydrogenase accessory sulfurtransferase FdhD [Chloroflexota bacterium]
MDDMATSFPVWRFSGEDKSSVQDMVVREFPLTVILNNRELVTLLCSPGKLKYLAIGFLFAEGLLKERSEIKQILVDAKKGVVRVATVAEEEPDSELFSKRFITSGCGRGATFYNAADATSQKIESPMTISATDVYALVNQFQHSSQLYRATGGVHSAALCSHKDIIVFAEDIGRHNAIDKIFGECILNDIATDDRMIITSGRISSEVLLKVAKRGIPILISKSAPTDYGVELADTLGVTLISFVRGKRMSVYTHQQRVVAT